ncbi:DUF4177 domain-containing protein [Phaeovulum sp.]|uniref:DUF4177 domain-containing protein n=1 Tax=Phaeovulum sp. TaxID=2934796 RepID=UPI0039E2E4FF
MQTYEYRVIPAPNRGEKERGLKTGADRFAHTLTQLMNQQARDGWEYLRADTLPTEERSGLTSKNTVYHNLLVFRRPLSPEAAALAEADEEAANAPQSPAAPRRLSARSDEGIAPRLGPAEPKSKAESA